MKIFIVLASFLKLAMKFYTNTSTLKKEKLLRRAENPKKNLNLLQARPNQRKTPLKSLILPKKTRISSHSSLTISKALLARIRNKKKKLRNQIRKGRKVTTHTTLGRTKLLLMLKKTMSSLKLVDSRP